MRSHSEGGKELKAAARSHGSCPEHQVQPSEGSSTSKGASLSQTNVYFKSIICLSLCEEELELICLFFSQPLESKPFFLGWYREQEQFCSV